MLKRFAGMIVALLALNSPGLAQAPFTKVSPTVALSVSSVSSNIAIGTSARIAVLWVCNTGATLAYIQMGDSTIVADTTGTPIPAGLCGNVSPDGKTTIAAVTASGTTTLTVTPGSGTLFGAGGGGGSGGGGGGGGGITAPNFGGQIADTILGTSKRLALPANATTYPAVVITPNNATADIYIAQGDGTVTASVTNATCAQGPSTFCSYNIATAPVCVAAGTFGDVAFISASGGGGGTVVITQWASCPGGGAPQAVFQRLTPFGDFIVNLNSINGAVPLVGAGASGAGSLRMITATDSGIIIKDASLNSPKTALASTPAAATDLALVVTQRQADLPVIVDRCLNPYVTKLSAAINITSATTTQLIAISGSTSIQVCSWSITISEVVTTANTFEWVYGTGASCGTGTTALSGLYGAGGVTAGDPLVVSGGQFSTPGGAALCATTAIGASGSFQGMLTYVQS